MVEYQVYCWVGDVQATVSLPDGTEKLVDNAISTVPKVCAGCKRYHGRNGSLRQHLVDKSRFISQVPSEIVVAQCMRARIPTFPYWPL